VVLQDGHARLQPILLLPQHFLLLETPNLELLD
jgi:hypothetical protein